MQLQLTADDDADEEDGERDAPSVTGSMGSAFGGKSELFYNQFELYSREQKVTQIILLKDAIYRIKSTFNKEFDEVLKKKELELSKVLESLRLIVLLLIYNLKRICYRSSIGNYNFITTFGEEGRVIIVCTP